MKYLKIRRKKKSVLNKLSNFPSIFFDKFVNSNTNKKLHLLKQIMLKLK